MPEIGEIVKAKEIGKRGSLGNQKYVWTACKSCGKERWTQVRSDKKFSRLCLHCWALKNFKSLAEKQRGAGHPNWKGGKTRSHGYVLIKLFPDDFFYSMRNKAHYVLEHRLVMAKHLGRCLQSWEIVDHKNAVRDDNKISNLELKSQSEHMRLHHKGYKDGYANGLADGRNKLIKELQTRITLLEAELKVVRAGEREIPGVRIWSEDSLRRTAK